MRSIGPILRALGIWAGLTLVAPQHQVLAQASDWPCVQRLVPDLEPGLMWPGPALEPVDQPGPELQEAARKLIDPKVPADKVTAQVQDFAAQQPEGERARAMGQLFALSLDWLNDEREAVIRGVKRYAVGQKELADRIVAETKELAKLQAASPPDEATIAQLQTARDWDTRIFGDRQKQLSLVCEQPIQLEQRAFALARRIQEQLP